MHDDDINLHKQNTKSELREFSRVMHKYDVGITKTTSAIEFLGQFDVLLSSVSGGMRKQRHTFVSS